VHTVGYKLRQRRESRGISLEAAMRATKMTRAVLMALEEDRYHELAAPVYVRGFLKIYAQYLEIAPDSVVEAYEAQIAAIDAPQPGANAQLPDYLRDHARAPGGLTPAQSFLLVAVAAISFVFLWSINRTKKPVQMTARPGISAPATATGPTVAPTLPNARRPVPGKDMLTDKQPLQPR
jgi:cytoskeletal protein RodZ